MSKGLLLDTHAWIWLRFGTLSSNPDTLEALRHAAGEENWFVCSFSFFEIAHAVHRKRLLLNVPLYDWLRSASAIGMPTTIPLSPSIAAATLTLPATFHGDPGDRIIAATAIAHDLTICTHDNALLRFGQQGLYGALKINEIKEKHVR
jgi:PIN domain nuclease of toxin-antitoxin system